MLLVLESQLQILCAQISQEALLVKLLGHEEWQADKFLDRLVFALLCPFSRKQYPRINTCKMTLRLKLHQMNLKSKSAPCPTQARLKKNRLPIRPQASP